jgi:hypothetical protein
MAQLLAGERCSSGSVPCKPGLSSRNRSTASGAGEQEALREIASLAL